MSVLHYVFLVLKRLIDIGFAHHEGIENFKLKLSYVFGRTQIW